MHADCKYSYFSGVPVVKTFKDHYNFVMAQPLVNYNTIQQSDSEGINFYVNILITHGIRSLLEIIPYELCKYAYVE